MLGHRAHNVSNAATKNYHHHHKLPILNMMSANLSENPGLPQTVSHVLGVGPAGLCQAAGTGSLSPAPLPVQEEEGGSHRAAGSSQRIPGQEGVAAKEKCRDPPAGSHQRDVGKKSSQKDEKRCEFSKSIVPNHICLESYFITNTTSFRCTFLLKRKRRSDGQS